MRVSGQVSSEFRRLLDWVEADVPSHLDVHPVPELGH